MRGTAPLKSLLEDLGGWLVLRNRLYSLLGQTTIDIDVLTAKVNAIGRSALWICSVGEDLRNSDNYVIQVGFLCINASLRVNHPVARITALNITQSGTSSLSYLHVKVHECYCKKKRLTPLTGASFVIKKG